MSGESVPLREHIESLLGERDKRDEQRFMATEKAINAALSAAKEAVAKAETATEKRFESVNEFRKAMEDIGTKQMPRIEAVTRLGALDEKHQLLIQRMDRMEGRTTGIGAAVGYVVAAAAVGAALATIVGLMLRHS